MYDNSNQSIRILLYQRRKQFGADQAKRKMMTGYKNWTHWQINSSCRMRNGRTETGSSSLQTQLRGSLLFLQAFPICSADDPSQLPYSMDKCGSHPSALTWKESTEDSGGGGGGRGGGGGGD